MAVEAAVGATIIAAIHGNRANRAGNFSKSKVCPIRLADACRRWIKRFEGIPMPRGRSTFTKRQKEHTRQQRQRDKAERRNRRKQEEAVAGSVDEMAELRKHAAEQAALFNVGAEDGGVAEESTGDHLGE